MATTAFDPVAYKETTRQQWQEAAAAWHRWGPALDEWLGGATTLMLDLARIGTGSRVLDVAAGAGNQTLAAGEYRVSVVNPASDQKVLRFTNREGDSALVQVHAVAGRARTFHGSHAVDAQDRDHLGAPAAQA